MHEAHDISLRTVRDPALGADQDLYPFFFSIVFSCWTRTLDLVSVHLTKQGIRHQRIDGDQVLSERQANMDRFVDNDALPVLLMTTGVGAFGYVYVASSCYEILTPLTGRFEQA